VRVEAGPFEMGSHKDEPDAYNNEYSGKTNGKRHRVEVAAFEMGRYPVTNAEYRCFIRSTGHEAPRHWINGEIPQGRETHPVVDVSWHDAAAYCEWLSKMSGRTVRLPTEAEWEKAARWDRDAKHSRIYPWDDDWDEARCNTAEAGPGDTTPVGLYPDGASASGALDMSGNVWEWTSSLFKPYPYDLKDGREDPTSDEERVLRGGAFFDDQWSARCAYRHWYYPYYRYGFIGFRVALSPL
jgi:formylglycine-generating enzyme required for sulfatase activity